MNARRVVILLIAATAAAGSPACTEESGWSVVLSLIRTEFPAVRQISTDSLQRQFADPDTLPLVLDVRTGEEFAISHIPGAIHVDTEIPNLALLDTLDRATPIVTYCSVGYRSSALAQSLTDRGFTNVANLEGSLFKWANEGRPLVRDSVRVLDVHPYDAAWGRLLEPGLRTYSPRTNSPSD